MEHLGKYEKKFHAYKSDFGAYFKRTCAHIKRYKIGFLLHRKLIISDCGKLDISDDYTPKLVLSKTLFSSWLLYLQSCFNILYYVWHDFLNSFLLIFIRYMKSLCIYFVHFYIPLQCKCYANMCFSIIFS